MKVAPIIVVNSLPHNQCSMFDQVSKSLLGQIIEAAHATRLHPRTIAIREQHATTQSLPSNCKHGLLDICCAICKKQNEGGTVDARGSSKTYQLTHRLQWDKPWSSFRRCAECAQEFVNQNNEPIFSQVALHDKCKESWLAKHPDQCDLSQPTPRFQQVTPEDVDWCARPSLNKRTMQANAALLEHCSISIFAPIMNEHG